MTIKPLAAASLALWLTGCVPSLNPLFTAKDTVADPAFAGVWQGERDRWIVELAGPRRYVLTVKPAEGPPASFSGHLVQLGGARFLDLYPEEFELPNGFLQLHLVPAHTISRVWLEGDRLRAAMLDEAWLRGRIRDGQVQIDHLLRGDSLVLTASTPQLQALVTRFAGDAKAFPEPQEFRRRTSQ